MPVVRVPSCARGPYFICLVLHMYNRIMLCTLTTEQQYCSTVPKQRANTNHERTKQQLIEVIASTMEYYYPLLPLQLPQHSAHCTLKVYSSTLLDQIRLDQIRLDQVRLDQIILPNCKETTTNSIELRLDESSRTSLIGLSVLLRNEMFIFTPMNPIESILYVQ